MSKSSIIVSVVAIMLIVISIPIVAIAMNPESENTTTVYLDLTAATDPKFDDTQVQKFISELEKEISENGIPGFKWTLVSEKLWSAKVDPSLSYGYIFAPLQTILQEFETNNIPIDTNVAGLTLKEGVDPGAAWIMKNIYAFDASGNTPPRP